MVLFNKRITKALIRLRGCAGWSAFLLIANPKDRFSRVEAHLIELRFGDNWGPSLERHVVFRMMSCDINVFK